MKLTFLGAAHEVTGSCTLLEACGKNILIDLRRALIFMKTAISP